jgi:hypothetical protein
MWAQFRGFFGTPGLKPHGFSGYVAPDGALAADDGWSRECLNMYRASTWDRIKPMKNTPLLQRSDLAGIHDKLLLHASAISILGQEEGALFNSDNSLVSGGGGVE